MRYFVDALVEANGETLRTIYMEFDGRFVSTWGPYSDWNEDESRALAWREGELAGAGWEKIDSLFD